MLEFSHEYFEDEVRDGFFVNSVMKKCWAAQMEVLSDIDLICKEHGMTWYADCGTLLGAVRHGGFVPWDDDLDICMFRDDYYTFLSIASRELTNIWPEYKILNYHNEEYWEPISRIVNADNIAFSEARLEKFHGYPLVAGIDIFPLDFVCPNEEEENARKDLFGAIFDLADSEYTETIDRGMLEELAVTVGKKYDGSKSTKLQLYEWGEIVSSIYLREEAKDVCLMHFWYKDNNHIYPMELFDKTVDIPFENITIHAPAGYNEVLKIEYGDYMKLVRTGGIHDYPHYESQIEKTEEWLGEYSPFHKSITEDCMKNIIREYGDGNPRKLIKDSSINTVGLLKEAHEELGKLLNSNRQTECLELLSQCQDIAIQIGTYIESEYGEGFVTVKHLEEYCEDVYTMSQILYGMFEDEDTNSDERKESYDILNIMNCKLNAIENSINTEMDILKEIVFIPFKNDYWSVMEPLWRDLSNDPSNKVIVMPIPYYEKSAKGEIKSEFYDTKKYPDDITVIDYNTYDFAKRQPDQIIIQYPYNNDNFVTAIDSRFYAQNLKRYTDKLIYIPYFKIEEIGQGEDRAYKVMDNYVLSPGVVYSDKVIVQSDDIRNMYIKKLVDFFGEETRNLWDQKIDGTGAYLYEENIYVSKESIDMPDEWRKRIFKSDGTARKVVIYKTSISGLFEYKDKMIDKMKTVFDTFENNNNDVAVIWRPDNLVDATIPTTAPELFKKYKSVVEEYKLRNVGIYDDSGNDERLLMLADAYYGDTDKIVQKCRKKMIPVMIQNVDVV